MVLRNATPTFFKCFENPNIFYKSLTCLLNSLLEQGKNNLQKKSLDYDIHVSKWKEKGSSKLKL